MLDRVFTAAFFVFLLAGCDRGPFYFRVAPIDARVIDANTKLPIQGAIVTANWQLVVGSLDGIRRRGQLEVLETQTDTDGRFHLDGFIKLNLARYELRNEDPRLVIFKDGYAPLGWTSEYWRTDPGTVNRSSSANGKLFELKPLDRSSPDYLPLMEALVRSLGFIKDGTNCEWKRTPRMVIAIDKISESAQQHVPMFIGLKIENLHGQTRGGDSAYCGSAGEYLNRWRQ